MNWNLPSNVVDLEQAIMESKRNLMDERSATRTSKKKAKRAATRSSIPVQRTMMEIIPRSKNQSAYLDSINGNVVTFGFGSAGSGKTFLAACKAAEMLELGKVDGIVVVRPAVEAGGEKLGFLPGGIEEKMDPFLRPIFDAFDLYWNKRIRTDKMARGDIEICPLAYMRGRTFTRKFVIADEFQNATEEMVRMLLTRIGEETKVCLNGDPTQRDKYGARGWEEARSRLEGCPGIGFIDFDGSDVVRSQIVKDVLARW